jgi:EAL and modified HD-GYP domain-containing signal transduction protein
MNHPLVLDHVLIGYSPVFDRQGRLCATRLTISPSATGLAFSPQGAALLDALEDSFQEAPAQGTALPALLLNLTDEAWLDSVLKAASEAPRPCLLEVPGFLAIPREARLTALRQAGQALGLGGGVRDQMPASLLACFRFALGDASQLQAGAAGLATASKLGQVYTGLRLSTDIEAARVAGAVAQAGWPMDDEIVYAKPAGVPPQVRSIVELMNRVEREEPPDKLEAVLVGDPTLAFRLLRYLNSAAFGLRVEVTSFKHALMMLGHQRLKRWLALLLASGGSHEGSRAVMAVASRRGLLMEGLGQGVGDDAMRGEMFICGVFSLLDRLLQQPMDELLRSIPVQQRVQQSLLGEGPYSPYLNLVRALEQGLSGEIREAADNAMLAPGEVNHALLRALSMARELD